MNPAPKKDVVKKICASQKKNLMEFMKKNPDLCSGKHTKNFTAKHALTLWHSITSDLNSMACYGGPIKDWKSWRKVRYLSHTIDTLHNENHFLDLAGPKISD